MYNDFYPTTGFGSASSVSNSTTWLIIAGVIAVVGGLVAYFMFVAKPKDDSYDTFLNKLHDYLNFKKFFVEDLLKVLYTITAIFITLGSFSLIGTNVAGFFGVLIFGNLGARIAFELILMLITLVSNTSKINDKLDLITKKDEPTKEVKPKKKPVKKDKPKDEEENA